MERVGRRIDNPEFNRHQVIIQVWFLSLSPSTSLDPLHLFLVYSNWVLTHLLFSQV